MVATVQLFGFLMVHIPLQKVAKYPALSNLLMDMSVNAILGACIVFLKIIFVFFDPFGSSRCRSPIPTAFSDFPSAVVISHSMAL